MNMDAEDMELLRDYVVNRSEPAFQALVQRHVDMVYATALRQTGDSHLAEEATQAVFITLARKAPGLAPSTILAGWLFRAARFAGAKAQRTEARRKHWEQQAAQMELTDSDAESAWDRIAPHLNDALNELKESDRAALILRFFESKSMAQIGGALGTSEGAAKMRIARALEQLRAAFQSRGIALPATLLLAVLSTHAAPAAPAGLAAAITTSALLNQTTTPLLTKGLILFMTWNNRKTAVAAIVALLLCTSATGFLAYEFIKLQKPEPPPVASRSAEPTMDFILDGERVEGGPGRTPGERGTLRIVNANGDVIITNGVQTVMTIDSEGRTNEITIMTENRPTRAGRSVRVRAFAGPGGPGGGATGAGFGGEAGGRSPEPVPAPEPR